MLDEPGTELGGAPFGVGPLIEQHVAHVTGQAADHGQPLTGRADAASGPTNVADADRAVGGGHEGGLVGGGHRGVLPWSSSLCCTKHMSTHDLTSSGGLTLGWAGR